MKGGIVHIIFEIILRYIEIYYKYIPRFFTTVFQIKNTYVSSVVINYK